MKFTIALALMMTFAVTANAATPTEIKNLINKSGEFTSLYNGKVFEAENGGHCTVSFNEDEEVVSIDAGTYFAIKADLEGAKREISAKEIVYTTTDNGKRVGGSVCGDYIPLTSYKKSVIITKNSLTVKQKFTCAVFDRNEIVETCTIK